MHARLRLVPPAAAALALALAVLPAAAGPVRPSAAAKKPTPRPTAVATFAGGCFWCLETAFEGFPGVIAVISGYTGGTEPDPTYEEVSSGRTGHAEAVQVRFDPARVSYARLLDRFWTSIDPTQAGGAFCDVGEQYRSAIYWHDESQRTLAEESKAALVASGRLPGQVVTEIAKAGPFHHAEEYHQDFWKKNPLRYRAYRAGCGRDRRLEEIWGKDAAKPLAH